MPHICPDSTDEEEEENTEDQDEQGNLRGLIDDGDEEDESQRSASGGASDSEEELKHHRKKRSEFSVFIHVQRHLPSAISTVLVVCVWSMKTDMFVFSSFESAVNIWCYFTPPPSFSLLLFAKIITHKLLLVLKDNAIEDWLSNGLKILFLQSKCKQTIEIFTV